MKILKPFYLILLISIITACSSDNSEIENELNIDGLTLTVSNIGMTTATIKYFGNIYGEYEHIKILYKEKNSTENYQENSFIRNQLTLTNLQKATEYDIKVEVSNNSTNVQSTSYYFTTKYVNIDYLRFFSSDIGQSPYEFFSHINKNHIIHAEGLSEYNDVKIYLVNEQKTDSLQLATTVVSDSLSFTIPNNYLTQIPRESVKKTYLGLKINNSYQYILNANAWVNLSQNPNFSTDEPNLKLNIYNDKPYVDSVNITVGNNSTCSNYTNLRFNGEFYTVFNQYYWKPNRAELIIFNSTGSLYNTYVNNYDNSEVYCDGDSFNLIWSVDDVIQNGTLKYHHSRFSEVRISNFPAGEYTAKIIFTFENILESIETNIIEFEKE